MAIRLVDIAKQAGVSHQAVSAVLNARAKSTSVVGEKTRKRVLDIAHKMGYRPHAGARAIAGGRFNRIASTIVQYGQPGGAYFPNNGYTDAAADYLAKKGYSLVHEPMYLDQMTDAFLEPPTLFSEVGVDGVLALAVTGIVPEAVDREMEKLDSPTVWLNRNPEETTKSILCDEYAHGRMLTRHLVELGHTRIGYVGWETPHYSSRDRFAGVRDVLSEEGLEDTYIVYHSLEKICNVELAEEILDRVKPPMGLICYNRQPYITVLHEITKRGLRVPQDISLCYFASQWETALMDYRVTAIQLPEAKMAASASEQLLALIAGRMDYEIPPAFVGELKVGWTTAPPGEAVNPNRTYCDHKNNLCVNR